MITTGRFISFQLSPSPCSRVSASLQFSLPIVTLNRDLLSIFFSFDYIDYDYDYDRGSNGSFPSP